MVFPACFQDVSEVVKVAASNRIEIAVRGGGHATSGSSSTEGGICIDLSRLRGVSVDRNSRVVTVEGGALWEDVDRAAAEHGLAVVGGTVNVGVKQQVPSALGGAVNLSESILHRWREILKEDAFEFPCSPEQSVSSYADSPMT